MMARSVDRLAGSCAILRGPCLWRSGAFAREVGINQTSPVIHRRQVNDHGNRPGKKDPTYHRADKKGRSPFRGKIHHLRPPRDEHAGQVIVSRGFRAIHKETVP